MASAAKKPRRSSSRRPKSPCSTCSDDDPSWTPSGARASPQAQSQGRGPSRAQAKFRFEGEIGRKKPQSESAEEPEGTSQAPGNSKTSKNATNQKAQPQGKGKTQAKTQTKTGPKTSDKTQTKTTGKAKSKASGKEQTKVPRRGRSQGPAEAKAPEKSQTQGRYQPVGPLTLSRRWLQDGSGHYRSVTDDLNFMIKKQRLNMALNCYYKALNIAETLEDKASASKNMGLASWKMATVFEDEGFEDLQVNFYYKEAMKYMSQAKDLGKTMPQNWLDKLCILGSRCWTEIMDRYGELDLDIRKTTLIPFLPHIVSDLMKAEAYLERAENFFKCGITALQKKDFKGCLSMMRDCYFPISEARRVGSEFEHIMKEVKILEKDTFLHTCIAESMQALETGDRLFEQLVDEEEHLNMELVYEIIDLYKKSILLTRDQDLELEAIGHSRLGRVYHRILKMKDRAKENFKYALDLARAMEPRNFYVEEWYKTAADIISQYQQEINNSEEAIRQREKEAILKEIKKEVTEVKNNFNTLEQWPFLQFVYKTFPPKNPKHVLGEFKEKMPDYKTLKKLYQKAVVHYHPDKADEEKNGKQWKVLSEEITKYLTQHYEHFKL